MEVVCGCQTRGNNNVVQFGTRIESPSGRKHQLTPLESRVLTKACVYFKISLKSLFENKYVVCRAQFPLYKPRDPSNNGGKGQRAYPHTNQSNINHYVNT